MGKPYRVLLAEDHAVVREGLRALCSFELDLEVIGEAGDGAEAIQLAAERGPDLVILDLSMPRMSGLDALQEIKRVSPETRVLVLTVHATEEFLRAALRAGADGYVLKESTSAELLLAVRKVMGGHQYLDAQLSSKVIAGYLGRQTVSGSESSLEMLTPREREVLHLVAEGHRTRQIAKFLCISIKTVEKHRASLMRKLDCHSPSALTAYAIEKGLVSR